MPRLRGRGDGGWSKAGQDAPATGPWWGSLVCINPFRQTAIQTHGAPNPTESSRFRPTLNTPSAFFRNSATLGVQVMNNILKTVGS